MSPVVIVPTQQDKFVIRQDGATRTLDGVSEVYDWLSEQVDPIIHTVMGGPAQYLFFSLAWKQVAEVHRVPQHPLYERTDLARGASAEDRAAAIELLVSSAPDCFYPIRQVDQAVFLVREAARQRLRIQTYYRKKAAQQALAAENDLRFFLDPDVMSELEKLRKEDSDAYATELRRRIRNTPAGDIRLTRLRDVFLDPGIISGATRDEKRLEDFLRDTLALIPIYQALRPGSDNGPLLAFKGLGPAIGGSIIGEILDIRRFESAPQLRSYAGYGVAKGGGMQVKRSGETLGFSPGMRQPLWLWSADQVPKQGGVGRLLYDWAKLDELRRHPEVIVETGERKDGQPFTRYQFTAGHIDRRAKRRVASMLLEYIHMLWWAIERGEDPAVAVLTTSSLIGYAPEIREVAAHFRPRVDAHATWRQQVTEAERIMDNGGREELLELIEERKRRSPDDESDDNDESESS